jgi:hypothetical protein
VLLARCSEEIRAVLPSHSHHIHAYETVEYTQGYYMCVWDTRTAVAVLAIQLAVCRYSGSLTTHLASLSRVPPVRL